MKTSLLCTARIMARIICWVILVVLFLGCAKAGAQRSSSDDQELWVSVYQADKVYPGTTIFPFNLDPENPRIIEVDMEGNIVWQYAVPDGLKGNTNPGWDVEPLDNGNILILYPGHGAVEINRQGDLIWQYLDPKVSHDADRLSNGNTLVVCGNNDALNDVQVKEVNPQGEVVWQWKASDHFGYPPYSEVYCDGFTHTNSATRLEDGNTLISLRNFNMVVIVDPQGGVVKTISGGVIYSPHDPEYQDDGHILLATQYPLSCYLSSGDGDINLIPALEIDPDTGQMAWSFGTGPDWDGQLTRDVNRLPNGNTLVVGTNKIVEVTPEGEIVWELDSTAGLGPENEASRYGFYKATRISSN